MNDLDKILHQLRLCKSRHAPDLASKLLDLLLLERHAECAKNIIYPQWGNIKALVEEILQKDLFAEQRIYIEKLHKISATRGAQEQSIACMSPERNLRRAALFSNHNAMRYTALIKKLLRHSSNAGPQFPTTQSVILELDETSKNIHILFDVVRLLHRTREQKFLESGKTAHIKTMEFYEALYASMVNNLNKPMPAALFCGFQTCDLCWRLVPSQNATICRCEKHSPYNLGLTYTRALKIAKFWGKRRAPEALTYLQQKISGKLTPLFRPFHSTEAYYAPVLNEVGTEDAREHFERIPLVSYAINLHPFWKILSRTREYILKHGGDPYHMDSVLATLDPPLPDEPEAFRRHRLWLHQSLCRDPSPFKSELSKCEAWLRLHATMFGHLRHGGPRRNAGGKRAGAGRPAKAKIPQTHKLAQNYK